MQLIIQSPTHDYNAWKAAFDAEAENIADAGLSTLQIWHVVGGGVAVLFEVGSATLAREWLEKQSALGHSITATFLETV